MRNLLGWPETRLAQITLTEYLKYMNTCKHLNNLTQITFKRINQLAKVV